MVFPTTTDNFHVPKHFDAHHPYSLGKANQQHRHLNRYGESNDATIDRINTHLSGVYKDPSFDSRNWGKNDSKLVPIGPLPVGPHRSLIPEILTILAVAVVAGILAYTRPEIFANLFKLFIGYEVLSLIVGVVLVLLLLAVYLFRK
jgi:hypothetical protein